MFPVTQGHRYIKIGILKYQYTKEMVLLPPKYQTQNNQAQNTQSQKIFDQNVNFCKNPSLKFWTATNRKLWILIIPISAKLIFLSPNEMPMKLENYYKKQPTLILFHITLIFPDTQMHEPKISDKTVSEYFGRKFRKKWLVMLWNIIRIILQW